MSRKKSSSKKQQAKKADTGALVAARSSSVSFPAISNSIESSSIQKSESI
ncbi:hypothetical protein [Pedobacter sp. GR22-6]